MTVTTYRPLDEAIRVQLEASREHFSSEGARGKPASFNFESLEGLDLSDVVMVEGKLRETVLSGSRLINARMMGVEAPGASFDDTDASGIDLAKANLEEASFRRATMRNAVLRRARLQAAAMENADLSGGDLFGAICSNADLRGAVLAGTDLGATIFAGADLCGADLSGARLERTLFDERTVLHGVQGLDRVNLVSIVTPNGLLNGWKAAAWLARHATTVPPDVAFQAYLLGQMSSDEIVARGCEALDLDREQVNALRALLGMVFDVAGHATAEYTHWIGVPERIGPVQATGSFEGSSRSWWRLSAWPLLRFGVSTHPDGYAWGMGFDDGTADPLGVGTTTLDRLRHAGVRTEEVEHWPPMLEVIATLPDGRAFELRFDFGLLQRSKQLV